MSVNFSVSDVEPCTVALETSSLAGALASLTKDGSYDQTAGRYVPPEPDPIEAGGCETDAPIGTGFHPLIGAARLSFDRHYPLRLSPDHVWITIAQGLAEHLRAHGDRLPSLVGHEGKLRLEVRRDDFAPRTPNAPWAEVVSEFGAQLRTHLGKRHDLVVADFSTTTEVTRTASIMVLMSAVERHFDYRFTTRCGIPSVTLDGSPEDWRSIRSRVEYFRELELDFWVDALDPVLAKIVDTAEGRADPEFWRSFFKLNDESGGPYANGWINTFFPYVERDGQGARRNPFLTTWSSGFGAAIGGGPTFEQFPRPLAVVPVEWNYLGEELAMEFVGGLVGLAQDATFAVSPAAGWVVRPAVGSGLQPKAT